MHHTPVEPLFDEVQDAEIDALLAVLGREITILSTVLPEALARQWEASPVPKPREDTTQRASGLRPNPTADIVFDSRRMAVRETVLGSTAVLREAVVRVRGARRALEIAVERFDGEGAA